MTTLATGSQVSTVSCVIEAVLHWIRDKAAARGVQIPGDLSTDIRWVGSPVMPCPGVLVSALSQSAAGESIPGCLPIPEIRIVAQIGRGCQIAFEEDGTTNPQAALGTTLLASHDAEVLWAVADDLGSGSPSLSFETSGGMLITSIDFSTTPLLISGAGAGC